MTEHFADVYPGLTPRLVIGKSGSRSLSLREEIAAGTYAGGVDRAFPRTGNGVRSVMAPPLVSSSRTARRVSHPPSRIDGS